MRRISIATLALATLLLGSSAIAQRGPGRGPGGSDRGPGGGMGGSGRGDWGAMWERYRQQRREAEEKRTREESERKLKERVAALLAEGWSSLKAGDTAASVSVFYDVLELKPDETEARVGLGLSRAADGQYTLAQKQLELAVKGEKDRRLATYNLAVLFTRLNQKPRAAVLLNTHLASQPKIPDEMVLNAQRSLVFGQMDDAARKGIGLLPQIQKVIAEQDKQLSLLSYPGQERFGVAWVPAGSASKARAAGVAEIYSKELPFVLPDMSVLRGKHPGDDLNTNLPTIAADLAKYTLANGGVALRDPPPTVSVVEPPTIAPAGAPVVAAPGDVNGTSTPAAAPPIPDPAAVAGTTVPPTAPPVKTDVIPEITAAVTLRGAAFCVAPGIVATCARTVEGASSIRITPVDGDPVDGELVSVDAATGVALVRTAAKLSALPLADSSKSGRATVACFAKANLFEPQLDLLQGDLTSGGGKAFLRLPSHPRSAGAPVLNDEGKVIGLLSASRDDPAANLPVIPVEALLKLLRDQTAPVTAVPQPYQSVAEITAIRKVEP